MSFPRAVLILCPLWFLPALLPGQNLVPNGSFEDYTRCPGSYTEHAAEFRVRPWRALTTGLPDYFNSCSNGEAAVPYNWAGVSEAYDGYGYAGIYAWMDIPKEYREYLHCKLTEPLIKDSLYHVSFRYKLSSYSKYAADRIGLLLSDGLRPISNDRPLTISPTVAFVKDSALTPETGSWELAVAEYRAKGKEEYITIGNFSDNAATRTYHLRFRPESQPMLANSAYYYIDDVKVIPGFVVATPEPAPPLFATGEPELNTVYVLQNIQFEFNSYALLPVSYSDLDKVAAYLREHPGVSVRLSGHTDDVGTEAYNLLLSSNRAKSAAAYLVAQGVDSDRIIASGYGERQPIAAEEAREKNRRVEIEFFR